MSVVDYMIPGGKKGMLMINGFVLLCMFLWLMQPVFDIVYENSLIFDLSDQKQVIYMPLSSLRHHCLLYHRKKDFMTSDWLGSF